MTIQVRPSTRDRLLNAMVALMRLKGAAASSTTEILNLADAPRGSFYFHFPDGKDQLVLEALKQAAAATLASLEESLADDHADLADQVRAVFDAIAAELRADDYAPGCAVGVTTLESTATSVSLQQAVNEAFTTWTSTLANRLAQRGVAADRAVALAETIVATMEGATMLARARRTTSPLRHAADTLELAINGISRY